ncbi:carbamoyltransferase HypF [Aquabacterium sp.]|uniref:carbamoyltransferase HypF n=1 Tax=Aquabacterium sp. TaxID=1872578 RepID=UPI0035B0EBA0
MRHLRIRGLVQGVGFRPYVWQLARELNLAGWVRNDGQGVSLAVGGEALARFLHRLPAELPPLARIDAIEDAPPASDVSWPVTGFAILDSVGGEVHTAIGPDAAICPDCAADICQPEGRRWRHAFATCTHCGPRFTVSRSIPYDRARTSLAPFPLCPACEAEYRNPADRRFHAETTCCPVCGPHLSLLDAQGHPVPGDPIEQTVARLRAGQVVAIKGLGGFHLACDARQPEVVAQLRARKHREAKPLAVMGLNAASLQSVAHIGPADAHLLDSTAAPIVLCPRGPAELDGIAPGLSHLGVMRPATPLHLLLWHEAAGRPAGTDWLTQPHPLLLVMTSANPHGEPLVRDNDEALSRLAGLADAFLLHDRDIVVRCDDSVVRADAAGPTLLRRARGHVPAPLPLRDEGPTVLALGAYLKNSVCVSRGQAAILSQHIGSLDNAAAVAFQEEVADHLLQILDVRPDVVAHDLHPDAPSTHLAATLAARWQIPAIPVAHHHAHLAALCAEHGLNGPVTGLALDGVGIGPDGGAWGGELLRVDGARCERLGHLHALALPGGDRAAREPWRIAISALHAAGLHDEVDAWAARHAPARDARALYRLLDKGLNCPRTSSLGRWFDAAAGLLGVRDANLYEGQAAMELESLAAQRGAVPPLPDGWRLADSTLDLRPLLTALLHETDPAHGAALFHSTLAAALADWARTVAALQPGDALLLAGGCALNQVLASQLRQHLHTHHIGLIQAHLAPPNDGGIALGQAWVARHAYKEMSNVSRDTGAGR